ncbi:hypothetical protein AQJ46_43830 [Streptomyces canus]|uniref:VWFA domain-containing protein n=1 Tax=Streptomyces canus TaxID=58343 RepID=A0A101RM46_9ACTN|nr:MULTISPECIES: hypothetical protein [Streptomyces]KUN58142.1 hypothetical protein AQJ46_43830 [Streptomyces canus]MDI5904775.1 hypothetical protein [Streptomyces sp. 12257]
MTHTSDPAEEEPQVRQQATAADQARIFQAGRDQNIAERDLHIHTGRQRKVFVKYLVQLPRSIKVVLLLLLCVALIAGGGWIASRWILPEVAPTYRTQFLVDTARGTGPRGLADVAASMRTTVGNSGDSDALSLRAFGGACGESDNTRRLTDFATGERPELVRAAEGLRAAGEPTLVRGIVEAVQDFSRPFDLAATQMNRVIVITRHGTDACDDDIAFVENEIRERIRAAGLRLEFRLIGYQVPKAQRERLRRIAAGARAPDPVLADTPQELQTAVDWYANDEPVMRGARKVIDALNPAAEQVDAAVRAIDGGRFEAAEKHLGTARGADARVSSVLEDLAGRTKKATEADIHARAARLRDRQRRVIAAAGELLDAERSGAAGSSYHRAAYGRAADAYNTEVEALNMTLAKLRDAAPVAS